MTPEQFKALSAPEYLAFLRVMDEEARELRRQARKHKRG